ncbi:TPA: hypothetical protein ACG0DR_002861 [Enterobacter asburiae]
MNVELKVTLWAIACAYALFNSFIYSMSFWSVFDIDILQFASLTDLIPSIIYTLTLPFIMLVTILIFTELWKLLRIRIEITIHRLLSSYSLEESKVRHYSVLLTNIAFILIAFISLIILLLNTPDTPSSEKIPTKEIIKLAVPFFVTVFIIFLIVEKTSFIANVSYRRLIIFCLCSLPATSNFWAIINSQKILRGNNTFLVKSDSQCKSSPETKYRYISSISDKAFALSLKDGSICIFKYNHLELIPEKMAQFTEALDSRRL